MRTDLKNGTRTDLKNYEVGVVLEEKRNDGCKSYLPERLIISLNYLGTDFQCLDRLNAGACSA